MSRALWAGVVVGVGLTLGARPLAASSVAGLIVFANGSTADADDVNTNFARIKTAVDDNDVRITALEAGGVGVDGVDAQRWVSFNGENGVVLNGSEGVSSVERIGEGEYVIRWATPFASEDYVVTGSCNMLGSGGSKFGLEGNNERGHSYEGMTASQVTVGCRNSTNSSADSDLVHVMAVEHSGGFVVFDGDGPAPITRDSSNVESVRRVGTGEWEVTWATPFADRNYLVTGACNLWGSGGAKFGLEGNNIPLDGNEALFADRLTVGCRDSTNAGVDVDLVMLTALPSDGGGNPPAAWAVFNGEGGVNMLESSNVDSIVRNSQGRYTVNWTNHFDNTDYIVTGSCNLLGTSGSKFGLEGNNLPGDSDEFFFEDRLDIGCRDSTNAGSDSDLIHVIAYATP